MPEVNEAKVKARIEELLSQIYSWKYNAEIKIIFGGGDESVNESKNETVEKE